MRIAMIGGHGGRSGLQRHIRQLCTHLAPHADVLVVSDVNEGGYDFLHDLGVEHRVVRGLTSSLNPIRLGQAWRDLRRTLDAAGPIDVIWAHSRITLPLSRAYVRKLADPPRLIATYHGSPFSGRPRLEALIARGFECVSLRRTPAHDLVFISQSDRDGFVGLPTHQHHCHLISNCSDLGAMPPSNGPKDPTLVMTTRACRQKDLRSTAKIFEALPHNYRLVMLGIGVDTIARRQFQSILAPEVFERVEFHAPVADVRPFLVNADGYLLTSLYEGQSIGSLEAFEAGLPVIMPEVGGAFEMRKHHPQHAIIRKDQPMAAARKITSLVTEFRSDRLAHIRRNHAAWNGAHNSRIWGARIDKLLNISPNHITP